MESAVPEENLEDDPAAPTAAAAAVEAAGLAAGLAGRSPLLLPEVEGEGEEREEREVCRRRRGLRIAADGDGVITVTALITATTLQVSQRPRVATAPIVRTVPPPQSPPSHRLQVRQGSPGGLSLKSR